MHTHIGRRLSPSEKNWRKLLKVWNVLIRVLFYFLDFEFGWSFVGFWESWVLWSFFREYWHLQISNEFWFCGGSHREPWEIRYLILMGKISRRMFICTVREKAQLIVDLLKNKDILEEHRKNLKNLQEKVLKKSNKNSEIFFLIQFN